MKSNEPTTEQIKLQKYLEDHLVEGETVLWQGKPDMNICFEKTYFSILPMFYLVASILFLICKEIFLFIWCTIMFVPIILSDYNLWLNRKRSTFYAITDKRAIDLFIKDSKIAMNEKRFPNEIKVYRISRFINGSNLYLSRYCIYPWRELYENPEMEPLRPTCRLFSNFINNVNYFCFFDLADVDTPAALIKQYTNAAEYIDPKQRAREEKRAKQ